MSSLTYTIIKNVFFILQRMSFYTMFLSIILVQQFETRTNSKTCHNKLTTFSFSIRVPVRTYNVWSAWSTHSSIINITCKHNSNRKNYFKLFVLLSKNPSNINWYRYRCFRCYNISANLFNQKIDTLVCCIRNDIRLLKQ